jgi:hypothetical protein
MEGAITAKGLRRILAGDDQHFTIKVIHPKLVT